MGSEREQNSLFEMLDKLEKDRSGNSENILEFALEVYSACEKENYEVGMAFALMTAGQACYNVSKYEDAMTYLFDSIKLSQSQGVYDLQLISYISIGNIYTNLANYEKGLDYYNNAQKLSNEVYCSKTYFEDFSVEEYNAKIANNIGEIYRLNGCYEEAVKYYNSAMRIGKKLNYNFMFGIILSNIGNLEYHLKNYEKAIEYLNEAEEVLLNNNYKFGLVETYETLALIHKEKRNYEESEKYFLQAINIASETGYAYNKIEILINFSKFLEQAGKKQSAISKLQEAYDISVNRKMYAKAMEVCKIIIEMFEKIDDKDKANTYYKLYFENEKKLEPIESEKRIKNLKTKLKIHKLEKENESILEKSESFRKKSEELIKVIKNISIISELGEKITTTLNLEKIYGMLRDTIQSFINISAFGVGIYSDLDRKIEYAYYIDDNKKIQMKSTYLDNASSMAARCLKENKTIIINDMQNEYLNYVDDVNYVIDNKDNEHLNSAIFCPLVIDNNLIGIMTAQSSLKNSFTMINVEMIKALSSYAAIAINNAMKSMKLLAENEQRRNIQTQLEQINNKLIYLSENDALTGIPNRRKFDSIITDNWHKSKEKKSPISLAIFDVDHFKQYNDNFGHTEGDKCLVSISRELSKSLIKNYFAARFGGDEFVIVLPDTNFEEAVKFAENFRRNVENLSLSHRFSKVSDVVTITLGVSSVIPNDNIKIIDLIRQADDALYEAKQNGKNQVKGLEYIV